MQLLVIGCAQIAGVIHTHTHTHTHIHTHPHTHTHAHVHMRSGGELQRVAIALCLGQPADIYLIDEPSAYLDSEQRIMASKVGWRGGLCTCTSMHACTCTCTCTGQFCSAAWKDGGLPAHLLLRPPLASHGRVASGPRVCFPARPPGLMQTLWCSTSGPQAPATAPHHSSAFRPNPPPVHPAPHSLARISHTNYN